ncbi:Crp/Fnr family transcriptional regulator [Streptomyces sp. NPDC001941]|uniref:Crp/Fnr family transcriptional regulator n=1 Tax=Streptomyces sp. NPDC001941 TaxID=3154659 RepID=UPI00331A75A1
MSTTDELAEALLALHRDAGSPSYRDIEARTEPRVSRTTLSDMFAARRLPRLETLLSVVRALGGADEPYRVLWTEARRQLTEERAESSPEPDAVPSGPGAERVASRTSGHARHAPVVRDDGRSPLVTRLVEKGVPRVYSAGEILLRQGERGGVVHVLLSGFVSEEAVTDRGDRALLGFAGPGDVVPLDFMAGLEALFSAVARTEVLTRVVPVSTAAQLIGSDPAVSADLLRRLVANLRTRDRRRSLRGTASAVLAQVLRVLVDRYGDPAGTLPFPLSQSDLAALCGTSERSVHAALNALRSEGVLVSGYRRIRILDRDALDEVADGPHW